jgi:pre-rRNA-processing protein TSR3
MSEVSVSNFPVKIYIYYMKQDDPKKCTALKLHRFHLAKLIQRVFLIPKGAVVLNPLADRVLFSGNRESILHRGLVSIDCSWEKAEAVFARKFRGANRRLPILLAANPINYGKASKLSSLEALAAALYITGFERESKKLLSLFKWGPTFLALNKRPLIEYRKAESMDKIKEIEKTYF